MASENVTELLTTLTVAQYDVCYNFFSLVIAAMGTATTFFFFQYPMVAKPFRTALVISGLVTAIACYHYIRIFGSFTEAYTTRYDGGTLVIDGPHIEFNDAYRYVDWLLTVPLLLTELILVMNLGPDETRTRCLTLGGLAAIMIILGYPGEISSDNKTRWVFWVLAMIPFIVIVVILFVGLKGAVDRQPEAAKDLVSSARFLTVISWCTYPIVFILPMCGVSGGSAFAGVQVGYSIADLIAKPGLGLIVWMIASRKSELALESSDA